MPEVLINGRMRRLRVDCDRALPKCISSHMAWSSKISTRMSFSNFSIVTYERQPLGESSIVTMTGR
jgi:hypothetical protein